MVLVGNEPKTIGGPGTVDDATKQRCVARLSAWCTLAKATINAEFPSFDVLCAFAVFDLTPRDDQKEPLCEDNLAMLSTIAHCLKLNLGNFSA
eukprot:3977488-Alexandrium_andersonii.AAC.1